MFFHFSFLDIPDNYWAEQKQDLIDKIPDVGYVVGARITDSCECIAEHADLPDNSEGTGVDSAELWNFLEWKFAREDLLLRYCCAVVRWEEPDGRYREAAPDLSEDEKAEGYKWVDEDEQDEQSPYYRLNFTIYGDFNLPDPELRRFWWILERVNKILINSSWERLIWNFFSKV